jgi:hypothetical protein
VDIPALPRKIIKTLKKIYDNLSKRAYSFNLDFTKRKFFNVTLAVVALILLSGLMLAQVMSAIQTSSTISNTGTLRLSADIGVYRDSSFTNAVTAINWGTLQPGDSNTYSVYVRNEGGLALTLSMSTSNWSPPSASNYLTLTWNYNGQTVNANEYVRITFTLSVSDSITGISDFSFDINVVGSG